jgi:predicted O-linked N-acetylglucosamine transferase (SPINDLY family)
MEALATAVRLFQEGRAGAARRVCEARLADAPGDVAALSLLAEIAVAAGDAAGAEPLLLRLVSAAPQDAAARRRLGQVLLTLGRCAEAAAVLRAAIALDPRSPRAHNNLGQALLRDGAADEAERCFDAALMLDPGYAIAHCNRGLALAARGAQAEARAALQRAVALAPALLPAWLGLGRALDEDGETAAALGCFLRALQLAPRDAVALPRALTLLLALQRPAEALQCVAAADLAADAPPALHNLHAEALRRLNRPAEAAQALDRVLLRHPQDAMTWCNRGIVAQELADDAGAHDAFRRAAASDPGFIDARMRLLGSCVPAVPESTDAAVRARLAFRAELDAFLRWLAERRLGESEALRAAQQQFFYLSYDEEDNRQLLAAYRAPVAAQLQSALAPARTIRVPAPPAQRRFRLGLASAHVFDHSVHAAIQRGWLQTLDRARFEIHLFDVGTREDAHTAQARGLVDGYTRGLRSVRDWGVEIAARGLDALIYPEVGMHETTLALASQRLAPRQLAAWGHPETTGLPTIDDYLSACLFESPGSESQYSERLVRLPNLGVYCDADAVAAEPVELASLGLPADRPLLVCPGVPFKYRPQDDALLVAVARRIGRCTLVFFGHEKAALSQRLHDRLRRAFAAGGLDPALYLAFIPWQPRPRFLSLLAQATVYLDTVGFSGFNTILLAVQAGLPCVTLQGRFLRGRLGSGVMRRMGLDELVAADRGAYVDLAVRLATDAAYRIPMQERLRRDAATVYRDTAAVRALEECLLQGGSAPGRAAPERQAADTAGR